MSYNEKIYEIKNGEVTILVKSDYRNAKFDFKGLMVSNKPNILFKDYVSSYDEKIEGKSSIQMSTYILEKLKEIASNELKEYLERNINRTDFYYKKDEYGEYSFWKELYLFKNKMPKIEENITLSYDYIADGIAEGAINGICCVFDFLQDDFISFRKQHDSNNKQKSITPFNIFYKHYRNLILALEQYKRRMAHKAFSEIIRLNEFLEGKKSIKLYFKDGLVVEYKDNYGIRINSIIEIIENKFYIARNYSFRPELKSKKLISELDYLQYGKNKYIINADNYQI